MTRVLKKKKSYEVKTRSDKEQKEPGRGNLRGKTKKTKKNEPKRERNERPSHAHTSLSRTEGRRKKKKGGKNRQPSTLKFRYNEGAFLRGQKIARKWGRKVLRRTAGGPSTVQAIPTGARQKKETGPSR